MADPKSFHYLNQSKCYELDGVDDSHEYLAIRRAMDIVGINVEEQVSLLRRSREIYLPSKLTNRKINFSRRQYLELWLQYFILVISNLQREKR